MGNNGLIKNEKAQIGIDFLAGVSIFLLALMFVGYSISGMFLPFQTEAIDLNEQVLFKNQTELKNFLANDTTNLHTYTSERFDCDDYTQALINNASAEGYLLYFLVASRYEDGERKTHASCLAMTQDEGIFRIEPQTDGVEHWGYEL